VAIVDVDGRPRSVRTQGERLAALSDNFESLSDAEKAAFIALAREVELGSFAEYEQLVNAEYERLPVDPRTFLLDPYYMGRTGVNMFPQLQEDFVELFTSGYSEAILGGSIGWGKSFFASCGLAYVIYQMSCLKDPQQVYGLAVGSKIIIALLSMTREVARRVPLAEMHNKLVQSPYFKEKFPFKFASTMYEIRFGKGLTVVAGSTSSAVIGGNVFAAFIDEASFMGDTKTVDRSGRVISQDKGAMFHSAIIRRMKSRFQVAGKLPGVLFTVSSKERPVAFVEKRIEEVRQTEDPTVFVREYATWEVKPRENFSPTSFQIAVGNDRVRSVLEPTQQQVQWYLDNGMRIINVPDDYLPEFESDLEGALRDVAGVATEAVSPFIHRIEKISEAEHPELPSPLAVEEWVAGTMLEFNWHNVCTGFTRRLPGGYEEQGWRPKRNPNAIRFAHIDPALSGDSAGICIAHISGWIEVVRKDQFGGEFNELAPVVETDLLLGVKPPPGDEIFLGDLRSIIYQFMEHGFSIAFCSLDRYQSADTMQQLRLRGVESELTSVDRTPEPYEMTKTAIYENRLNLQSNAKLLTELQQLQRMPKGSGYKIDHPKMGSKDIADALAGCCYNLLMRLPGRPMAPVVSTSKEGDEKVDHSWVTGGKVMVPSSGKSTVGPRGIVGSQKKRGGGSFPMPFIKG
jgi:hypothetical protein